MAVLVGMAATEATAGTAGAGVWLPNPCSIVRPVPGMAAEADLAATAETPAQEELVVPEDHCFLQLSIRMQQSVVSAPIRLRETRVGMEHPA